MRKLPVCFVLPVCRIAVFGQRIVGGSRNCGLYNALVNLVAQHNSQLSNWLNLVMYPSLVLFGQLCLGYLAVAKNIPTFAGPWIADVKRVYACDHPKNELRLRSNITHFNPARPFAPQTLTAFANFTHDLDDSQWARGKVDIRSNNQWKENAFVLNFRNRACTAAKENLPPELAQYFHLGTPCVSKAGTHNIVVNMTWRYVNFPVMPYGTYRAEFSSGPPASDWISCVGFIGKIIPKP
ncbi:hypothetical protein FOCC_FOCC014692 [Frankliniella occidentalis]|uniref:Uncharacterized protein LOC113207100 isoform X1 n=1 Tax=Frankliniella occidentalis TaxID=133901 RepID=A0A6J1SDM3_FRAOC|nr:uncharacterized protein LOC113207100 isoform X1 [Frankliniella occidentalis]KAE8739800.1 hypothetical protein FOCC_FOCC014692 [Frankliniella occidentalis]